MLDDLRKFLDIECGIVIDDSVILVHMLWADDLILLADTEEGLQRQLDGLHKFISKYQLIVNTLKTKILVYGNVNTDVNFMFNNSKIEVCTTYKYLGVLFNSVKSTRGNIFRDMTKYVKDKSRKASFVALKKCSGIGKISTKIGIQLFNSYVQPVLEYGSEIWSKGKEFAVIESVQLGFLKMLLGVKGSTASCAIYAETGQFPTYIRYCIKTFKYYCRLLCMNNNPIVKKVFLELDKLDKLGLVQNNWVTDVRKLFNTCNVKHLFNEDDVSLNNCDSIMNDIKTKLQLDYVDKCMANIKQLPILRSYCKFKMEFGMEHYLKEIRDYDVRSCFSKLRLSSHSLQIEKGRHVKPKLAVEKRICECCDMNAIEDEIHMLLFCPLYNDRRVTYLQKCKQLYENSMEDLDDNQQFHILMSSKSLSFQTGLFIKQCFKTRKHKLES